MITSSDGAAGLTKSGASLFDAALAALQLCDPAEKVGAVARLRRAWLAGEVSLRESAPPISLPTPGRPARPPLVPPREVPRRGLGTPEGRAALVHAVAHIEFNAINLALDAVYRFRDLPRDYYDDWLRVADEEARHFSMLAARLTSLGRAYGDLPAHNGLWEMAVKTADDWLLRMALVPRVLEARGLDVTPGMIERLRRVGDVETVAALEVILREEVGHVAVGSRWYAQACAQRGLEPEATFRALIREYAPGQVMGMLHREARLAAGFSAAELDALEALADARRAADE
ncbi:ferritin-like domain-containing protein [Acidihalobacter ferrooxydans]|uniref:DUF455 domain-containing protein n=1 Tax=Acidihalobacter ferrooxydans TaxID=1765967 RepID=A0A1P8UF39_9GAMM|nr:ferritin-like domain-containing protein [Acidihalobacter ferrooxydans]APZ42384.1 hypothetical protein BW247_04165 [Acidihalobacter ferrooxydans]